VTTPAADRLIFAGEGIAKIYINKINARINLAASLRVYAQAWVSARQLGAKPLSQTPKQHLAAVRADRRARARRQKSRLKKPITY
jgi:predicted DNA-binding ribbon-helix-helix protein